MKPKGYFDIQSRQNQGRVKDAHSHARIYKSLPRRFWPYAQLARWDRPIGWQLLMWPCWWSVALVMATDNADFGANLASGAWYLFLFFVGSVAMRGAGCTYNDLVDEEIDARVERTRSRPLPSAQVSRLQAKIFLIIQALVGLLVLLQFNFFTIILGSASLLIVALYPFMKRMTDWPQLFLGLAFNWGALLGWSAWHGQVDVPAMLLYAGAVLWTIGYDTIYAHQDREDDALVGVRSTARLFWERTQLALILFYAMMLVLFSAAFALAPVHPIAYSGLILAAFHLFYQIMRLDIESPEQCLRLFRSNGHIGWLIFSGLALGVIVSTLL